MDSKRQTFRVSIGKAAKWMTAAYFAVLLIFFGVSYVFGVSNIGCNDAVVLLALAKADYNRR